MLPSSVVRKTLDRLIKASPKDGYASISTMLGRNHAYIYQFIKQGSPERLHEEDRKILTDYFGTSSFDLGGPGTADSPSQTSAPQRRTVTRTIVKVPYLDVLASAGSGSIVEQEGVAGSLPLDYRWLRRTLGVKSTAGLAAITVEGESMMPTLSPGDQVLVDSNQRSPVSGGIFVLRREAMLHIKRLQSDTSGNSWTVTSDNPDFEDWPKTDDAESIILGRVLWVSRQL